MRFAATKPELRGVMRAKLAALSPSDARAKSVAIWERLAILPEFARAQRVLVYVSKEKEVDTHGLIQQLLALGRQVCVPAFDIALKQYGACQLHDFHADLAVGQFGILEPKARATNSARLSEPFDAGLVPGLAFDETGTRLGRGMGHFDRLLRDTAGVKIALAYDFQILNEVPAEAHDARVDFIVTETRVVETKGNRP